jgi:hypothetical protein
MLPLGLVLLFGSTLWTLERRAAGNYANAPAWLDYGFRLLFLVGIGLAVFAIWRWRRAPRRDGLEPSPSSTAFRPQLPWLLEALPWAYPPVMVFTVLVIATQADLPVLAAVALLLVMLLGWPIFLAISMTTYEVTPSDLQTRSFLFRQSIAWTEVTTVRALQNPFGEQLEFRRKSGRPSRIAMPLERERFLAEVRGRATDAQFQV